MKKQNKKDNYVMPINGICELTACTISREEERTLVRQAQEGNEKAREKLIGQYLKSVRDLAYRIGNNEFGQDLFQEGCIGLLEAIKQYNPEGGASLVTYAYPWIKGSMMAAIQQTGRAIRIKSSVSRELNKLEKVRTRLTQELGHEPSDLEMAQGFGCPVDRIRELNRYADFNAIVSLDAEIDREDSSEDGDTISDIVADSHAADPETEVFTAAIREKIRASMDAVLTKKEAEMVRMRYGINSREHSQREIAARISRSPAYVCTTLKRAMKKLAPALEEWK